VEKRVDERELLRLVADVRAEREGIVLEVRE
jgi:hypothetical protein